MNLEFKLYFYKTPFTLVKTAATSTNFIRLLAAASEFAFTALLDLWQLAEGESGALHSD